MVALRVKSNETLKALLEGNRRVVEGRQIHPRQTAARRAEVAGGQSPVAVIVGCSDSRVPPEILFDQGVGDLFVIRTAGNVLDAVGLASVEYAVTHLGVRLVLVLGHTRCGAVGAALEGGGTKGHLISIIEAVGRAVTEVRGVEGDMHDLASRRNVERAVEELKSSAPILSPLVNAGALTVIGSYYDLDTAEVEIIC
jgi:carbonic anhydrase